MSYASGELRRLSEGVDGEMSFTDEQWKRLNEQLEISDNKLKLVKKELGERLDSLEKKLEKEPVRGLILDADKQVIWVGNFINQIAEIMKKCKYCYDFEKLDVGSASARESLDRQTVKQCIACRKYKTEDCPPWPTKGPDHWCTQFEPKASGGEKIECSELEMSYLTKDDSKLPEPKPSMACGDGPEPRPKTERNGRGE